MRLLVFFILLSTIGFSQKREIKRLNNIGDNYYDKDIKVSLKYYKKAYQLDSNNLRTLDALANALVEDSNCTLALTYYKKCAEIKKINFYNLNIAYCYSVLE